MAFFVIAAAALVHRVAGQGQCDVCNASEVCTQECASSGCVPRQLRGAGCTLRGNPRCPIVPCDVGLICQSSASSANARPGYGICCEPMQPCGVGCTNVYDALNCAVDCSCAAPTPSPSPLVAEPPTSRLITPAFPPAPSGSQGASDSNGGGDGNSKKSKETNNLMMTLTVIAAILLIVGLVLLRVRRQVRQTGGYDMNVASNGVDPIALLNGRETNIDQAIRQRMMLSTINEATIVPSGTEQKTVHNEAFSAVSTRAPAPPPPAFDDETYLDVGGIADDASGGDVTAGTLVRVPGHAQHEVDAKVGSPAPILKLWEPETYVNEDGDTEV